MNILVIGASGLVGWNCQQVFRAHGHQVTGTHAHFSLPGLRSLDAQDTAATAALLAELRPDVVINCTAWSWVDGCENDPARAHALNAQLPQALCQAAVRIGARFVHFSTSYVFDGQHGPYDEDALPSPISAYGRSKLAGEQAVQEAAGGHALIIRTMGVYGEEPQRKNFVYQVLDKLRRGKRMRIPRDQIGNATHAADLAEGLHLLLRGGHEGLWNLAGPEPDLRRDQFALRIAAAYDLDAALFDFVTTAELAQPAPRPLHGGLVITRATAALGWQPQPWQPLP